ATAAAVDTPQTTAVKISWTAAIDDQTDPTQIAYDVYQASAPGMEDFTSAPVVTVTGATEAIVTMTPATTGYWVVRARDLAGNTDANTVEVATTTYVSFSQNLQPAFS